MSVSEALQKRLVTAVADVNLARELVDEIQKGSAVAEQGAWVVATAIVATAVSQTTDFGALRVNDQVIMIPATAGNADLITITTAGNLGQAAVVGNIYLVLRPVTAYAASAVRL